MLLYSAGVKTFDGSVPFNLAAMGKDSPSRIADFKSKEAGQQNKEFHELVRKFLYIFYQGLIFPLI